MTMIILEVNGSVTVANEYHKVCADDIIRINRRVKQYKIATQFGIYGECAQIIIFKISYRILYGHPGCHGK